MGIGCWGERIVPNTHNLKPNHSFPTPNSYPLASQIAVQPPSIASAWPLTMAAPGLAR
jgi:hypothetical protein